MITNTSQGSYLKGQMPLTSGASYGGRMALTPGDSILLLADIKTSNMMHQGSKHSKLKHG